MIARALADFIFFPSLTSSTSTLDSLSRPFVFEPRERYICLFFLHLAVRVLIPTRKRFCSFWFGLDNFRIASLLWCEKKRKKRKHRKMEKKRKNPAAAGFLLKGLAGLRLGWMGQNL